MRLPLFWLWYPTSGLIVVNCGYQSWGSKKKAISDQNWRCRLSSEMCRQKQSWSVGKCVSAQRLGCSLAIRIPPFLPSQLYSSLHKPYLSFPVPPSPLQLTRAELVSLILVFWCPTPLLIVCLFHVYTLMLIPHQTLTNIPNALILLIQFLMMCWPQS